MYCVDSVSAMTTQVCKVRVDCCDRCDNCFNIYTRNDANLQKHNIYSIDSVHQSQAHNSVNRKINTVVKTRRPKVFIRERKINLIAEMDKKKSISTDNQPQVRIKRLLQDLEKEFDALLNENLICKSNETKTFEI